MSTHNGDVPSPHAWLVRAGRTGEWDNFALDNDVAVVGFYEVGDLSRATTREQVAEMVRAAMPPTDQEGRLNNFTGQLWALRSRIQVGDLVVLPLKTTSQIAIGRVTGGYTYRQDNNQNVRLHVIPVHWVRTDVPRTAVHQDLLYWLYANEWGIRLLIAGGR